MPSKGISYLNGKVNNGIVNLSWYKTTSLFEKNEQEEFKEFSVYRKCLDDFTFGSDYEEFFCGLAPEPVDLIYCGPVECLNNRKYLFQDKQVEIGKVYSYYELSEDNIQNDGKYNVMFTGEEATVGISQSIYGKATGEYNISLDFLLTSFNEGQIIPIYLTIITSDKQTKSVSLITFTPDKIKHSQEWQKLTASVDLKKYSATGTFVVWCLATKFTGKFYIDNFKVEEVK